MKRRSYRFASAADLLDIPPTRAKTTSYRERPRLSREYLAQVLRPARFVAALWIFSGASIVGGMVYVASEIIRNPQKGGVLLAAALIGAGMGGVMASGHFWRLHHNYVEVGGTIEETTEEHELEPLPVERREVPVTRPNGSVDYVQVSPRKLGGIVFSASQINAMIERANDDERVTRDTGGWSGTQYNTVREELAKRDFISIDGSGCTWTATGLRWLRS